MHELVADVDDSALPAREAGCRRSTPTTSSQPSADQSYGKRSGSKARQPLADDVDACRHLELEHVVGELGIDDEIVELDSSHLIQAVDELEPLRRPCR